jgi:uncharacterized caspase-like protein
MQYLAELQHALRTDAPFESLRQTVLGLRAQGVDKDILILELEMLRRRAASRHDENIIHAVLELMVGWAEPHLRID